MAKDRLYRFTIALAFLAAFFVFTFGKGFYVADYYVNPGKYAVNCVNKAKPEMQCNGKCQLMMKIAEKEQREQDKNQTQNPPRFDVAINARPDFLELETPAPVVIEQRKNASNPFLFSDAPIKGVFRPPCWL